MSTVTKEQLERLLELANEVDSPHVDLRPLGIAAKVGVNDLHAAVLARELPEVSLRFDGGTEVTISRVDGGAVATLRVEF